MVCTIGITIFQVLAMRLSLSVKSNTNQPHSLHLFNGYSLILLIAMQSFFSEVTGVTHHTVPLIFHHFFSPTCQSPWNTTIIHCAIMIINDHIVTFARGQQTRIASEL